MTLAPLTDLPPAVAVHLSAATLALLLGPLALYRRRRDIWHRAVGYVWVLAMILTALSALALSAQILPLVGGVGPIHLLAAWVLWQVLRSVHAVRGGDVAGHQAIMQGLYWGGLSMAGLLTLLPGRVLNRVLFPEQPSQALWVIGALGVLLLGRGLLRRVPARLPRKFASDPLHKPERLG